MNQQAINQAIYEACHKTSLAVGPYSGRGMYGKKCMGVVCRHPAAAAFVVAGVMDPKTLQSALPTLHSVEVDSLGTGSIMYWPGIEWQADWSEG